MTSFVRPEAEPNFAEITPSQPLTKLFAMAIIKSMITTVTQKNMITIPAEIGRRCAYFGTARTIENRPGS